MQLNRFTDIWNYEFGNFFTYISEGEGVGTWGFWTQTIRDIEWHDKLWHFWAFDGECGQTKSCREHKTLIAEVRVTLNPKKQEKHHVT